MKIQSSRSALMSLAPGDLVTESLKRLNPRLLARNPVMFTVAVGTLLCAVFTLDRYSLGESFALELALCLILLATVLFANAADALAEARGKAQAAGLRSAREGLVARQLHKDGSEKKIPARLLVRGDRVRVSAGELIPCDGEVVEGAATINESAVTGESAPVLREAGTDFSGVSAGTKVLSDEILIEVTAEPGDTLLDRMISLVESASRQKTPSEIALNVLLAAMTLIFLVVVVSLVPIAGFVDVDLSLAIMVALLVCLIPTTIGGLLPAIGIAGMGRALKANLVAKSGRAVEVAGNIDVLLLDKTGTITLGDRKTTEITPVGGVSRQEVLDAALLCSLADPTPEGQSTVKFCREQGAVEATEDAVAEFIPFSAHTRFSGVKLAAGSVVRKGAPNAIEKIVSAAGGRIDPELNRLIDQVSRRGATPLVVASDARVLGVITLSDVIKPGVKQRLRMLSQVGVKTIMITGDSPLTAAAIAAEAGVDEFRAEATPEDKLALIRSEQAAGRLVAMMGDGTNDAPALAQADLGLAMNSGTQAAREAGNIVDLDSDPGKLIDVIEIGKQLLITRGALTTFSLANDVAKYFVILPALFAAAVPGLAAANLLNLSSPTTAVLSAVIFNALIIPALIPFALKGVRFKPQAASGLFRRNLLIFGAGGVILPFPVIKLIDMLLALFI